MPWLEQLESLHPSRWLPAGVDVDLKLARDTGWKLEEPIEACWHCGASAGPGAQTDRGCSQCLDLRLPWRRLIRLAPYEPPMDLWVQAMKFSQQWHWCEWFGVQLAERISTLAEPGAKHAVTPVPMHRWRRWHRGYNQSQLIATAMARSLRWPMAPVLERTRLTLPQTAVPPSKRADNVRGSFRIQPVDLKGWTVWLVDDVKTTGSTLRACASLLKEAGAAEVHVAVVAVAERNRHHR